MALLPPLYLEAVPGDPKINYTAQNWRSMISTLAPNAGTVRENDLKVGPRAAGANMSVDVAAGKAIVQGSSVANQGTYIVQSTDVENVPLATADATNPRIDLIVAQVYDKQADGGTRYAWQPLAVTGTPEAATATSPKPPPVPPNSLVLAEVRVNAGVASVSASNITDRRVLSGTGDVPKWDISGTPATPQSIPNKVYEHYVPATTFQRVGMSTTGMRAGEFQCVTPGRYVIDFCVRLAGTTGAINRVVSVALYQANGTTLLRRKTQTGNFAGNLPVTVGGTVYMRAGERIAAQIYQDSGGNLSVDDSQLEANFTGVWVGP
jgi:hypothetical protein